MCFNAYFCHTKAFFTQPVYAIFMRRIFCFLFIFTMIAVSCQNQKSERESLNKLRQDFWKDKTNEANMQKATQLDSAYKAYRAEYPDDTSNAEFLFENAKLHLTALKNTDVAIEMLEQLSKKYPQSPRAPEAMYQRGFLLENELQLSDKAREQYQELIDKYPNHPFAKEAQITIKYVGKSPEEMLKAITDSANKVKPDTLQVQ